MNDKMKIVFVGHVDHGKSTLIGRLLYDTDSLPTGVMDEVIKASKELGRETEFAFILDSLEEERKQNITIDTTQTFFNSKKNEFVIIDAPGHKEFIKNMITGASLANTAILITDVIEGVKDQTKRHCYLLGLLGFKEVIVVVNKMDLADFSKERFVEVRDQIGEYLKNLDIQINMSIPISAKNGDNVARISKKMSWYEDGSLLDVLDDYKIERKYNDQLCFSIQDVYDFVEEDELIVGRVENGLLHRQKKVYVLPDKYETTILNISTYGNGNKEYAGRGECIGIKLENEKSCKRGQILTHELFPEVTSSIKGNIFWISEEVFSIEETLTFKCATQEVQCTISNIYRKFDPASLELQEKNSTTLKHAEIAEVQIKTADDIVITPFSNLPSLGRFVLEKNENIVAGGIVV